MRGGGGTGQRGVDSVAPDRGGGTGYLPRGGHRWSGQTGQSTVEVALLIPLVVLVVAAVVQLLAAGTAREQAAAAAEAGALAMLQNADPEAAAKDALGDAADRAVITLDGHRVRVAVRPRAFASPIADLLIAASTADAGEHATPVSTRTVIRGGDGESGRPRDDGNRASAQGALSTEVGP